MRRRRVPTKAAAVEIVAVLLAAALAAFAAPSAHAQQIELPVGALVDEARTAVVAKVISVTPRLAPAAEGHGKSTIETVAILRVQTRLKGHPPGLLTVTAPGGRVGDLTLIVEHAPVFTRGERCIFFLDATGEVVGWQQGKIAVVGERVPAWGQSLQAAVGRVRALASGKAGAGGADPGAAPVIAAASTPTITSITPPTGSAGTDTLATITGSGFGAAKGSGSVTFYYHGADRIVAPVSSWSDTQIVCTIPTGTVNGYPAAAGSGPVVVTNGSGLSSPGYDFTVTFAYSGARFSSPPVTFRFNANTSDLTGEKASFDAAAAAWNKPALFRFVDGGTCTTSALPHTIDGNNDVFWAASGIPSGTLAVTQYWVLLDIVVEADLAFNDAYAWGDGSGGTYDVQSIALHELGHFLVLGDQYGAGDVDDVMYGYASTGVQKRTLTAAELAGIVWIYGARPPMTGTMRIAGGAVWTRSTDSTLDSAVTNATQMRFRDAGGAWSTWQPYASSRSWTLPAGDGPKTVEAEYMDAGGNVYAASDSIGLDTIAPSTDDDADDSWHQRVTVTLSPSDGAGSGVASTQYRVDGGPWLPGTSVLLRTWKRGGNSGEHTVEYLSTDAAGNAGTPGSCLVRLDGRAPRTTSDAPLAPTPGPLTVHLSAVDQPGLSGVAATYYSLDGSAWVPGAATVVSGAGLHWLLYYSVDIAGNVERAWHATPITIAS